LERGIFITLEGIEGSGKTTQASRLKAYIEERGPEVVMTREPGGSPIGEQIRQILLDPDNEVMVALTELLLYEASRCQHVEEVIKPALERGAWVICDRFFDASTAYQGYGRGLDVSTVQELNLVATRGRKPDVTIVLDLPVDTGLTRLGKDLDRIEAEAVEFHERVREGYLRIAGDEPGRVKIVDATGGVDETFARIKTVVDSLFSHKK
jgi:dTMP kinase